MKKLRNLHLFYSFKIQLLFFASVNCFAQSIPPQELHFIKDYQIRNFYNSQVILSQLDFSKNILDDPLYKVNHQTLPGFWLVSQYLGMDETKTFKSWSIMTTILGVTGLLMVMLLSLWV